MGKVLHSAVANSKVSTFLKAKHQYGAPFWSINIAATNTSTVVNTIVIKDIRNSYN